MYILRYQFPFARFLFKPDDGGAGAGAGGAPATATGTDTTANGGNSAAATVSTTAGQQAQASQQQSSATATTPAAVGAEAQQAQTGDFREGWDDTLKNDPALKDFKTSADIAKSYVETKKLLGQKLGIPGPDATPEAKAAFHEAMGVPKEAAGYGFQAPADLPEALKANYDQKHADKWAGRMKELGIPKEAANTLRNEFFAEMNEEIKTMKADVEKSDAEFDKMATGIYGDRTKADAAMQKAKTIIEKYVPAQLKASMENLPNSALLILAAGLGGYSKEQSGEDQTISRDAGTTADGKTASQLREDARQIMASPEYNSPFAKGKEAHEKAKADVKAIYARVDGMNK